MPRPARRPRAARAGRLGRSGGEARARSPSSASIDQREEPRDVQVEPVFDRRAATAISDRRAGGGESDQVGAARDRPRARSASAIAAIWTAVCDAAESAVQAPDRERRAAIGLIFDRALVDRRAASRASAPGSAIARDEHERGRTSPARARRAAPAARAGRASPAPARAQAARTWRGPRAPRTRRARAASRRRAAPPRTNTATSVSLELLSSANSVNGYATQAYASATPSVGPRMRSPSRKISTEREQVEGDRRGVRRRQVVPGAAPAERLLERDVRLVRGPGRTCRRVRCPDGQPPYSGLPSTIFCAPITPA